MNLKLFKYLVLSDILSFSNCKSKNLDQTGFFYVFITKTKHVETKSNCINTQNSKDMIKRM